MAWWPRAAELSGALRCGAVNHVIKIFITHSTEHMETVSLQYRNGAICVLRPGHYCTRKYVNVILEDKGMYRAWLFACKGNKMNE